MNNRKCVLMSIFVVSFMLSCSSPYNENVAENAQFVSNKDGVSDFYLLLQESDENLSPLLIEENCYNVTTENIKATGAEIFKFKDECQTYAKYDDEIFLLATGFGGYGYVNAVTCDFDNNGKADILYTHSLGSGVHRSLVSVFNLTTLKIINLFSTFENDDFEESEQMEDLILEKRLLNNKVIYETFICQLNFSDGFLVSSANKLSDGKVIDFKDYQ
ncbi:MAG: hypothetical protein WCQ71_01760 [Bacilli bacterium]